MSAVTFVTIINVKLKFLSYEKQNDDIIQYDTNGNYIIR